MGKLFNNLIVFFKNVLIPAITGFVFVLMSFLGCQQMTQTTYTGSIQGWVYDSTLRNPLLNVLITRIDNNSATYTNDSGKFAFSGIDMPRSDYELFLIFEKAGYKKDTHRYGIRSDVLKIIDSVFMRRDTL